MAVILPVSDVAATTETSVVGGRKARSLQTHKAESLETLKYGAPALLSGAIDEIGQSFGIFESDETLSNNIKTLISPEFGDFYAQHREGYKTTAAIGTFVIPVMAVPKMLKAGGLLHKAIQKVPGGEFASKFIITSGKQYSDRIAELNNRLKVMKDDKSNFVTEEVMSAIRAEKLQAGADALKENVLIDLSVYGLLSESDLFFPAHDSPLTNLALYAVPTAAFSFGAYAFTGKRMMDHISATDGIAKDLAFDTGVTASHALNVPEGRGIVIASDAVQYKQAGEDLTVPNITSQGLSNARQRQSAAESRISKTLEQVSNDQYVPIIKPANLVEGSGEINNIKSMALEDPISTIGLVGLDKTAEATKLSKTLADRKEELLLMRNVSETSDTAFDPELAAELNKLLELDSFVVTKHKEFIPLQEYKETYLDSPFTKNLFTKTLDGYSTTKVTAAELGSSIQVTNRGSLSIAPKQEGRTFYGVKDTDIAPDTNFTKLEKEDVSSMLQGMIQQQIPFIKLRQELRNFADEDGFIPLYKTSDKKFAKASGTPEESILVHIDNIEDVTKKRFKLKNEAFDFEKKQAKAFSTQNLKERTYTWSLMQKALDDFSEEAAGDFSTQISTASSFAEIDFAVKLLEKYPERNLVRFKGEETLTGEKLKETLEFVSLRKKADEYVKHMQMRSANSNKLIKLKDEDILTEYDITRMLNLPLPTGAGNHPILEYFKTFISMPGNTAHSLSTFANSIDNVRQQVVQIATKGRPTGGIPKFSFMGTSLVKQTDHTQAPAIAHYSQRTGNFDGKERLNDLIATAKVNHLSYLSSAPTPVVKAFMQTVQENAHLYKKATEVDKIIAGTAPTVRAPFSANFVLRGQEVQTAADQLSDIAFKAASSTTKEVFKDFTPALKALTDSRGSQIAFDIAVNEMRHGWDLLEGTVRGTDNTFYFKLDPTSNKNKEIYLRLFGKEMPDDALLPISLPSAKAERGEFPIPVALDETAYVGLSAITRLSHKYLDEINYLRGATGLKAIPKRSWHVPFFNVQGQHAKYIVNSENKVVGVRFGKTEDEAQRLAQGEIDNLGQGYSIQTEEYIKSHIQTAGAEFEPLLQNFAKSSRQTGAIKGKTAGTQVNISPDTLKNIITTLQKNFEDLPRYTAASLFKSELEHAQLMKNSLPGFKQAKAEKATEFDLYERAVKQTTPLRPESALGKLYYGFESSADMLLAKTWDKFYKFAPKSASASMAEYEKFNATVGDRYNPFEDFSQFLQATNKVTAPKTLRNILGPMNKLAVNLILRVADLGMPLVNFASIAAVSPAVLTALKKAPRESTSQHMTRIGIAGVPLAEGSELAIPNVGRLMQTAVHGLFDAETRAAIKMETPRGLMKQEVAEHLDFITAPIEGYGKTLLREGVNKLSIPTDWSENMSRAISFSMFYNVARKAMGLDKNAARTFAHKQANNVVGDYRATNRPPIFQGATGMPFGLFTTWVWNFLQRFFGDFEGGRLGAASMQMGVQTFMFGLEGIPGMAPAIEMLTSSYDGRTNITDSLDRAYGPEVTNWALNGTISYFSGIGLQQRGAVTIPSVFTNPESLAEVAPGIRTVQTLMQGLGKIGDTFVNNGADPRAIAEAISLYSVNGAIKNMAQVGLGYSVDRKGQMVNQEVRRIPDLLARAVELKTLNETRRMKELQRDRVRLEIQANRMRSLRSKLRTEMRKGSISQDALDDILGDYYRTKGSLDGFKAFLRSNALRAQFSQVDLELMKALRTNSDDGRMMRLFELVAEDNLN
jgi:hypothetical protein